MFKSSPRLIGNSLVERGLLTDEQAEKILDHVDRTGLDFGSAGQELGLLRNQAKVKVGRQAIDFFHVRANFFPESTRAFFPSDVLLRCGVLPLGVKSAYRFFRTRQYVNLGFLDPAHKESVKYANEVVAERLGNGFAGVRIYLILPDAYLDVMKHVFGITEDFILGLEPKSVSATLLLHIQRSGLSA